jgi:hypothetical protein
MTVADKDTAAVAHILKVVILCGSVSRSCIGWFSSVLKVNAFKALVLHLCEFLSPVHQLVRFAVFASYSEDLVP